MAFYIQGRSIESVARELRRTERSVRDWLTGRKKVPWWVPEILRLRHLEHSIRLQEMGVGRLAPRLRTVDGPVRELRLLPRPELELESGQLELLPPQELAVRRRA